jgi:CubicO group peptidase (beta-lactamase class C family)
VRRITGQTLGAYLRESLAGPAGIDFFVGFGPELDPRCADTLPPRPSPETEEFRRQMALDLKDLSGEALMRLCAYRNPLEFSRTGVVNTRAWRAAEVPSTNGHGYARAVARLYSALAGNRELDGWRVPNPSAFGHFGAGGSLGFADPAARVAFGYAMNQGRGGWQHKHVRHFIDLVYAAL